MSYPAFIPSGFGQTIFQERYAQPDEKEWADTVRRVVDTICVGETQEVKDKIFDLINTGRFFPAGRTLRGWRNQNLNCFIFAPEDNVESIGDIHRAMYITACKGGGTGYNASKIRPKGADIGDMKVAAPGVVSFAKSIDGMLAQVRAGGSRRAAILGAITISHPDVLEWIRAKQTLGVLENHNISLYITDAFLDAVEADENWTFTFNGETWNTYSVRIGERKPMIVPALTPAHAQAIAEKFHRKYASEVVVIVGNEPIKARWLWEQLVESNLKCGEPGLLNESLIKEHYAPEAFEPWVGNNPCTEAVTGNYGNCTLGSINLAAYTEEGTLDMLQLQEDIPFMVRFLDNVLSVNNYPIPEQKRQALLTRRIGLGVMGYAHMLIGLGLRYGSPEALTFTEELFESIRNTAFEASVGLAVEKGPFEAYTPEFVEAPFIHKLPLYLRRMIEANGIRNAVLLSIAPTGTIGSVAGVSTSIEPIFAPAYERRWRDGEIWRSDIIIDPKFHGENREFCVGAYDVSVDEHLATLVAVQKYVDQSISKTINVPATVTSVKAVADTLLAHIRGIKGLAIYLEGSRGFEPLKAIPIEEAMKVVSENEAQAVQECATGACEI